MADLENLVSHAMLQNRHLHIRHISLIPFSQYLDGGYSVGDMHGTFTSSQFYSYATIHAFLNCLTDLPALKTLEIPYQIMPARRDDLVDHWFDLMTTITENGGFMRIVTAWTNSTLHPWVHYHYFTDILITTSVKIETWDKMVETDFHQTFADIYHAAKTANDSSKFARRNITVTVDEQKYVARMWGLPDKVKQRVRIKDFRRAQKLRAQKAALARTRSRLPRLNADLEAVDEHDVSTNFVLRQKESLTREEARKKRKEKR